MSNSARNLFQMFLKENSKEQINNTANDQIFDLATQVKPSDVCLTSVPEVSTIKCSGKIGTITISTIYELSTAREMLRTSLKLTDDKITDELARDFMNECVNVHGGSIRTVFEKISDDFQIGLPLHYKHIHEFLINRNNSDSTDEIFYWGLKGLNFELLLCAEFDLNDPKWMSENRIILEQELQRLVTLGSAKVMGNIEFFDIK